LNAKININNIEDLTQVFGEEWIK